MTPHPENQLKRRELRGARHALIGVLAIGAGLAITGGAVLLAHPDGHWAGPSLEVVVRSTLTSARTTALLLGVVIGGTQAIAAVMFLGQHKRARAVAAVAACLALAWAIARLFVDDVSGFQLALGGLGALELVLVAGSTPREFGKKHVYAR